MKKEISVRTVITFAGAIVAFLIGSGFATGQEVLQYFAAYGYWGIAGSLLTLILLMYVCSSFLVVGYNERFEKGNDIFKYYCGEKLGTCFDYFSTIFCFLSFVVMVAGAAATMNQHYNVSPVWGGLIIVVLAFLTVTRGLSEIVEIVGKVGPAIVTISIVLGIISVLKNYANLDHQTVTPALELLESSGKLVKASSKWYLAAFSYVGFCMLWLAGFLAALGTKAQSSLEAKAGGVIGALMFSLAVIVVALGLLSSISVTAGTQIPMLYLANHVHPIFTSIFALIIMAGIYTTAVPLLWSVSARFTVEKTDSFKLLTLALTAVGFVVGIWLPFDKLVNIVYVVNGYFGAILLLIMFYRSINRILRRKEKVPVTIYPKTK